MAELNEKQLDSLDEDRFAFPKERKEPLEDASHVRASTRSKASATRNATRRGGGSRRPPTNSASKCTKRAGARSAGSRDQAESNLSGCSIRRLSSCMKLAASHPSTTR